MRTLIAELNMPHSHLNHLLRENSVLRGVLRGRRSVAKGNHAWPRRPHPSWWGAPHVDLRTRVVGGVERTLRDLNCVVTWVVCKAESSKLKVLVVGETQRNKNSVFWWNQTGCLAQTCSILLVVC